MNRYLTYALAVVMLCLLPSAAAVAQEKKMYKWTDENGTVHFSDMKPEGQEFQEQDIPEDPAPVSSNPYQASGTGTSAAQQRRDDIAQKNQQAQMDRASKSAECAALQAEVSRLEPNRRIFYTNDRGETERMDDVERANRVAELKAQLAQNCN
jgi:hypothetical protein